MKIRKVAGAFLILTVVLSILQASLVVSGVFKSDEYSVFYKKSFAVHPLGVFSKFLIGSMSVGNRTMLVAVDMLNNNIIQLGYADSFGLSVVKFWKTDNYFFLYDGKMVLVFSIVGGIPENVGRFALDNLKGATVLLNGFMIAWSSEYIAIASGPNFLNIKFYDVWASVYNYLKNDARGFLKNLSYYDNSYNPDNIELNIKKKLLSSLPANATVVSIHVTFEYAFQNDTTPSLAHQHLFVNTVSAGFFNNIMYASINMNTTIYATGTVIYTTQNSSGSQTITEDYFVNVGFLARWVGDSFNIIQYYVRVLAGAMSSIMSFTYEPFIINSTAKMVLFVMYPDGSNATAPLYFSGIPKVIITGNYVFVFTDSGILVVYKSNLEFVTSFSVENIVDVGSSGGGMVFVLYKNTLGVLELGYFGYSGVIDKYRIVIDSDPVGVYIPSNDIVFIAGSYSNSSIVYISTNLLLAKVSITFLDSHGSKLDVIDGEIMMKYNNVIFNVSFSDNPFVISVPPTTYMSGYVNVPYGRGEFSFTIASPSSYELTVVVPTMIMSSAAKSSSGLFQNPFALENAIIRENDVLNYKLPGAVSMDAYGSLLAIAVSSANNTVFTSTVDVYSINGIKISSITLPSGINEVKFFYPYLIAKGHDGVYIIEVLSGNILGELSLDNIVGYDVDSLQSYAVAYSQREIEVYDIRRQVSSFIMLDRDIAYATVVNGMVYAFTVLRNVSNVYVINPITHSIVSIYAWNGKSVVSSASDGIFHALTYQTFNDRKVTTVFSAENGIINIDDGDIVWIKNIGSSVNLPDSSRFLGSLFGAVALKRTNTINIYIVGSNAVKIMEIKGILFENDMRLNTDYIMQINKAMNMTPIIVLKDYTGTPRVTIIPSTQPSVIASSENMIAYGNTERTILIPNIKAIGKYYVDLQINDELYRPLNANITIKELNITIPVKGRLKAFTTLSGIYHIIIQSQYYETQELTAALNDTQPVLYKNIILHPKHYTLRINILSNNNPVNEGTIEINSLEEPFSTTLNTTNPVITLAKGTYKISYTSELYTKAETIVNITKDTTITLTVNRTNVRITIQVLDEMKNPIQNATLKITTMTGTTTLTTDQHGTTQITIPYLTLANITASHTGYISARTSINATKDTTTTLILRKIISTIIITAQDEKGNPETANIIIKDTKGNIIQSITITQSTTIQLNPGTYSIEGTTPDGRTAQTTVTLTEQTPTTEARLIFPQKPTPIYITIFPYLLIATIIASIIILLIRKRKRKTKTIPT
jgi:hypothetical protein